MRAAIIALALLSCSSAHGSPDCTPEASFTADEIGELERAAADWSAIAHTPVRITSSGPWRIIKAYPPDPRFVGQTISGPHIVYLAPTTSRGALYAVALHEFGHVEGLFHVTVPGVMNPTTGATEFTAADIAECRRVHACD